MRRHRRVFRRGSFVGAKGIHGVCIRICDRGLSERVGLLLVAVLSWGVTGRRLVIAELFLVLLLVEALDVVIDDVDTICMII